jgi:hypothetical protein
MISTSILEVLLHQLFSHPIICEPSEIWVLLVGLKGMLVNSLW